MNSYIDSNSGSRADSCAESRDDIAINALEKRATSIWHAKHYARAVSIAAAVCCLGGCSLLNTTISVAGSVASTAISVAGTAASAAISTTATATNAAVTMGSAVGSTAVNVGGKVVNKVIDAASTPSVTSVTAAPAVPAVAQ